MAKYHVSPKTGRPNVCRADKRACPVGGEHYDSPEEARAAIEREAAEEFAPAQESLRKEPSKPTPAEVFAQLSPEDQAELVSLLAERRAKREALAESAEVYRKVFGKRLYKLLQEESCRESLLYSMRDFADSYTPGCSGCNGSPYGDYCRCRRYHDTPKGVNSLELARSLVDSYSDDSYIYDLEHATAEQKQVIQELATMVSRNGLDRNEIYEVKSVGGYYGDELEGVTLAYGQEYRFSDFHKELVERFGE